MTAVACEYPDPAWLHHQGPWTEEEYLALPEDGTRYELLDGSLLVSPAPGVLHQQVARRLANLLERVAPEGWEVVEAVNVRVAPSRILIPDVVILTSLPAGAVCRPEQVALVGEVVSPSTTAIDRILILKPQLYAAAGVPWYLRLELTELKTEGAPEAVLHELADGTYVERARAAGDQPLKLSAPVEVAFTPEDLLRR